MTFGSIYQKRCEIGYRLLLISNRKLWNGLSIGINIGDLSDGERIKRNGKFISATADLPNPHVSARFSDWVSVCNHYRALVFTQYVCECKCVQYENSSKNFKKNCKNTEIFHEIIHEQKSMFFNISNCGSLFQQLCND